MEKCGTLESDLQSTESQLTRCRERLEALSKAIGSPSDTRAAFLQRMVMESPMPRLEDMSPLPGGQPMKRPRLELTTSDIDLDTSADMFPADDTVPHPCTVPSTTTKAEPAKPSNSAPTRTQCNKFPKISSAATSQGQKRDLSDISNQALMANLNIMRKSDYGPTAIKNGYNGLGGHEKYMIPKPKNTSIFKKPTATAKPKSVFANNRHCSSLPKLPTLNLDE